MPPKGSHGGGRGRKKQAQKGKGIAKKQPQVPRGKRVKGEISSSSDDDLLLDSTKTFKSRRKSKQKVAKSPSPPPKSPTPPPDEIEGELPPEAREEGGEDEHSDDSTLEQGQGTQETGGEIYLH